ncbi:MAG: HAD family phosphatase [Firmicutes bacterium]|nr:HAD family phosphatase [Bacillota bacterium]
MKKGIILDFDGTIADTSYIWTQVDKNFFRKRNMDIPPDYVDAISTMSFEEGALYTKEKYSLPESIEDIMKEWSSSAKYEYENTATLKEGAASFIKHIKKEGYKIALATTSMEEYYTPVLKKSGVYPLFDGFVHGGEGVRTKAYPDMYLLAAKRIGCAPEKCTAFEDIPKGIFSAKKAGMKTVGVYDEQADKDWKTISEQADKVIYKFAPPYTFL